MDRRWPRFFDLPAENGSDHRDWAIPLDIARSEDNVTAHATLLGVNPDDIDVTVDDGVLSIKAEAKVDEERKDGDYVVRERRASLRKRRANHQTSGGRVQESQATQLTEAK